MHFYFYFLLALIFPPLALVSSLDLSAGECGGISREKANPYLWTLRAPNSSTTHHLFGTIHLSWEQIWDDIPQFAKMTFLDQSDVAVFELDQSDHSEMAKLFVCLLLQRKKAVGLLPSELMDRIRRFVASRPSMDPELGFIAMLGPDALSPEWIFTALQDFLDQQAMKKINGSMVPLDKHMIMEAQHRSKDVRFVERMRDHCHLFPSLGAGHLAVLIRECLDILDGNRVEERNAAMALAYARLMQHYKCGTINVKDMRKIMDPEYEVEKLEGKDANKTDQNKEIEQLMTHDLIVLRNQKWIHRLDDWIRQEPNKRFFFAFGAAHFINDQGSLVELFRQRGYTVNRVTFASILDHQNGSQQHVGGEHHNVLLANLMFGIILLFCCFLCFSGIILLFCFFLCTKRLQKAANNNADDGTENGGEGGKLGHLHNPLSMRNLEEHMPLDQQQVQQPALADENPYEIV